MAISYGNQSALMYVGWISERVPHTRVIGRFMNHIEVGARSRWDLSDPGIRIQYRTGLNSGCSKSLQSE